MEKKRSVICNYEDVGRVVFRMEKQLLALHFRKPHQSAVKRHFTEGRYARFHFHDYSSGGCVTKGKLGFQDISIQYRLHQLCDVFHYIHHN